MRYAEYTTAVRALASRTGAKKDIYIGALMAANALDKIAPDAIQGANPVGYYPLYKGRVLDSSDLNDIRHIPGIEIYPPTLATNMTGMVRADDLMPGIFRKPFNYKYVGGQMGRNFVPFISALVALYKERVFPLGYLSSAEEAQVINMLESGLVVIPVPSNARDETWTKVAGRFNAIRQAYINNLIDIGTAEIKKAQADVAFWGTLLQVVEIVAAPITAVTEIAKIGWNYRTPLTLAAIGVGVWQLYRKFVR